MAWLDDSSPGLHQTHSHAGQVDNSATDGRQVSVGLSKGDRGKHFVSFNRLAWESSHGDDGQGSNISKREEASPSKQIIFKHPLDT